MDRLMLIRCKRIYTKPASIFKSRCLRRSNLQRRLSLSVLSRPKRPASRITPNLNQNLRRRVEHATDVDAQAIGSPTVTPRPILMETILIQMTTNQTTFYIKMDHIMFPSRRKVPPRCLPLSSTPFATRSSLLHRPLRSPTRELPWL